MAQSELKYEQAWDITTHSWVTPEQVNRAEAHDRNRYFSEQFNETEDKGKVLTLHKQSITFKNKNGTEITRKAHFSAIADNTKKYRDETAKKVIRQESLIHKLCKEVIKDIKFIKIPEVKATILNNELVLIPEQYIKIQFKNIEKKDENTGRIPDAIVETEILGKKQELYIEFFYKHEIDENKRKQYKFYNINCIEVDLASLRDNLDESEKSLRNKIKNIISEEAYWINNKAQNIFEGEALDQFVLTLSTRNSKLQPSKYFDSLYNRMFIFKDDLEGINSEHPCYYTEELGDIRKSADIGDCEKCPNCVYLHNYSSNNIENTAVYCRKDGKKKAYNPSELISKMYKYMINKL